MKKDIYNDDLNTDEKVIMAIVRTAELLKRDYGSIFRNHGLSFPQYNILRVLEGSKKGQNKISDISRIMAVPNANMTGIAKRLEQGGFIVRKSDPRDERVTLLEILPKGKMTVKEIEKEKNEHVTMFMESFSPKEKLVLLGNVKRIIKNMPNS